MALITSVDHGAPLDGEPLPAALHPVGEDALGVPGAGIVRGKT